MAKISKFISLFLTLLLAACSGVDDTLVTPPQAVYAIQLAAAGEHGFSATLPDGTVYDNPDAYAGDFAAIATDAAAQGLPIVFTVGEDAGEIGSLEQPLTASGTQALPFGYVVSFNADDGMFIGGCISTNAFPGMSLRLQRGDTVLRNLQLGRYRRGGATCLGLYEQTSAYTKCGCAPRFPELPAEIRDALIKGGVSAVTAWVIAKAVAPVVTGVMVVAI